MAVDPAPEGRERHFPAWRHRDGLQEFTVAEELDFLLLVFVAVRGIQATRTLRQVAARVKLLVASIMQPLAEYVRGAKPLRRPSHVPG